MMSNDCLLSCFENSTKEFEITNFSSSNLSHQLLKPASNCNANIFSTGRERFSGVSSFSTLKFKNWFTKIIKHTYLIA